MKPGTPVTVTAGTLAAMTLEQFFALKNNVLRDGQWETADSLRLIGSNDGLGVVPMANERELLYIGIEKDGYTHS